MNERTQHSYFLLFALVWLTYPTLSTKSPCPRNTVDWQSLGGALPVPPGEAVRFEATPFPLVKPDFERISKKEKEKDKKRNEG